VTETVLTEYRTVTDRWQPRDHAWLDRPPSQFAGEPNRPLFIGSCPRSGSTLLRSLLNNHPDIAIPPETNVVIPAWRKRARYGDLRQPDNRNRLAEWIFDSPGLGGRRLRRARFFTREEAIARVMAAPPTLGSVFATVFEMFAEAKGKPRWGDKRPRYAGMVDMVFALFPNAQFVNLIRDPRGAAASQVPLAWDEEHAVLASSVCTWEWSVRRVDRFAGRLRPDQLLDVRFEDLVRDPEGTLQGICSFANLREDDDTVYEMIDRPRCGVFNEGWHDRLAEPISPAPIDSWTERLEPCQVALVEYATRHHLERFGYRPAPDLAAGPDPSEVRQIAHEHARRQWKWWRYAVGEAKRRHLSCPHPVAAVATAY
jgi:hypothetical protein